MLRDNFIWRYDDEERPKGCCYDCKKPYNKFPDMIIQDEMWERINPTFHEGAGLLCPECIGNRVMFLYKMTSEE